MRNITRQHQRVVAHHPVPHSEYPRAAFAALAALEDATTDPIRPHLALTDDAPLILHGEAYVEFRRRLGPIYGGAFLGDLSPADASRLRAEAPDLWSESMERLELPIEDITSHFGDEGALERHVARSLRARAHTLAWQERVRDEGRCLARGEAKFEVQIVEDVPGGFAGLYCGERVFVPRSRAGRSEPGARIIARLLKYNPRRGSFVFGYVRLARERPEHVSRWNPIASRPSPPDARPFDITRVVTALDAFAGLRDALLAHPRRAESEREEFARCWLLFGITGAMRWAHAHADLDLPPNMRCVADATHGDPSGAWAWAMTRADRRMFEVVWRATASPRPSATARVT